ncbi:MAG: hypothetical protein QXS69_02585 [Candidatus Aenigmatarchaeota archaeon]
MNYHKLSEKEKIVETIRKILSKYNIDFAIIFGSFATRNYFEDIDILIKGEIKDEIIDEIEKEIKIEIDVKDWNRVNLQTKFFAIKEGIRIIFNEEAFFKERLKTLNEYFDFKPIIDKYTKYYLDKI